ncbi:MAG: YHS domain-containing protein [Candidatus Limnocylindrales bacterium]
MNQTDQGTLVDPVCGMTVDLAEAEAEGLVLDLDGTTYAFCGRGCMLEFRDDPARFVDPQHRPSM